MTPQEVLLKAADLIETGGLAVGLYRDGEKRCAVGAIEDAAPSFSLNNQAWCLLNEHVGGRGIVQWNDSHTQAEVVAALRAAAGAPEAQKEGK